MQKLKSVKKLKLYPYLKYAYSLLSLILVLSFLSSCSKIESQTLKPEVPIFQAYKVTFNKTRNTTLAEANFRANDKNGVKLELNGNSEVKVNYNKHNTFSNLFLYFYRWNFTNFIDVEFVYQKEPGKIFKTAIKPGDAPDINIPATITNTIYKQGLEFDWIGNESDNKKTSVYFSLFLSNGKGPFSTRTSRITGRTIKITAEDLKDLNVGDEVSVILSRVIDANSLKEEDGNAGGTLSVETKVEKTFKVIQ